MNDSKIDNLQHKGDLITAGVPLAQAERAMILLHGRGASAEEILFLADLLNLPNYVFLAPEAAGGSWYPHPFTTPIDQNEPWLSSWLNLIGDLLSYIEDHNIPTEKIVLGGFSQGACLSAEYAVRCPCRYGGILVFSGGLIGPPGTVWESPGSLGNTPVFIGCSDQSPHIPLERVLETSEILKRIGGDVTTKIYPNLAHTVHPEELQIARQMLGH